MRLDVLAPAAVKRRPNPTRDRLARLALTTTLAFGVAACGTALDPRSVGPCGLVVSTFDAKNDLILEPPYRATMYHRPNHVDEVPIIWSGTGWGQTKVNITGPGRGLSSTLEPEAMIENRHFVYAPGTWRFRLASAECSRDFEVEVKPVP